MPWFPAVKCFSTADQTPNHQAYHPIRDSPGQMQIHPVPSQRGDLSEGRIIVMHRAIGSLFLAILAAAGCWRVLSFTPAVTAASAGDDVVAVSSGKWLWQGVGSCAASACHGGGNPSRKQSEYTTWINQDPHARAYQVLFDERSRRIVRNLDGPGAQPPEKRALCLHCHAMNVPATEQARTFTIQDSIGCERCHGPAEKWRTVHYLPEWQQQSAAAKESLGLRPTKDLLARAKLCVECHVGSAEADVNHDLIAAGHPRLNFEYGSYLAVLPKHWSERDEKTRYPDFEARAWAVGQVVCARAALELLASRADAPADGGKPWPEFAEYNCVSCHRDLRAWNGRQNRPEQPALGILHWGDWYVSALPDALSLQKSKDNPELEDNLRKLAEEMQKPLPDRISIAQQAHAAAAQLNAWVTRTDQARYDDPVLLQQLLATIVQRERAPRTDWDQAAQRYLAGAALYHALGDLNPRYRDPRLKASIQSMGKQLRFPKGHDSPR